jgi:hypothetical protein
MRKYGLIKLGLAAVVLTSVSAASEAADVSVGPAKISAATMIAEGVFTMAAPLFLTMIQKILHRG